MADFEYPSIHLAWNDPDFEEKIKSYVLEFYDVFRRRREEQRKLAAQTAKNQTTNPTNAKNTTCIQIDCNNLPKECISEQQFLAITEIKKTIETVESYPDPETDNPLVACMYLARHFIMSVTLDFIKPLIYFLVFDTRFHPEQPFNIDATAAFDHTNGRVQRWHAMLDNATRFAAIFNRLRKCAIRNVELAGEIRLLNTAKDTFFTFLQKSFPAAVSAIADCNANYSMLMNDFGTFNAIGFVDACIRTRVKLFDELETSEKERADIKQMRDDIVNSVEQNAKSVKNHTTAETDRTIKAVHKRKPRKICGHQGNGLKGNKQEKMDEQLKNFIKHMERQTVDDEHSIYYHAHRYWNWKQHKKSFEKAAKAEGKHKGYASYKSLAQAYKNASMKTRN